MGVDSKVPVDVPKRDAGSFSVANAAGFVVGMGWLPARWSGRYARRGAGDCLRLSPASVHAATAILTVAKPLIADQREARQVL